MKRLLCELIFSCVMATSEPMSVDELTYRTMLYDYYQGAYDNALVGIMVAEQQNRTGSDPVRFALAKGSVAFEDGLLGYARSAFAQLPSESLTDIDSLRIGFHLARVSHRQQQWAQLSSELDQIKRAQDALGMEQHPEVSYLTADLALQQDAFVQAGEAIDGLDDDEPFRGFGLFNLGVALRDAGRTEESADMFRLLTAMPGRNDEVRDLKERGRLALAHLARTEARSEDAKSILEDLPTGSRYRDAALAAYGTLAMEQKDFDLAARIWLTLKQDEKWHTSNAVAHLGFPMALEGMTEPRWVLTHYQSAEREYSQRLEVLEGVQLRTQNVEWVRRLAQAVTASGVEDEGLAGLVEEWEHDIAREEWLEWLAAEDVDALLREWRALADMTRWLESVPETLGVFAQVSTEQVQRTANLKAALVDDDVQVRRESLQQEVDRIDQRLAWLDNNPPIPDSDWMLAVADDARRVRVEELLTMIAQAKDLSGTEGARLRERAERLLGIVFYELADDFPDHRWRLQRQKQDVLKALADVDTRVLRVRNAEETFVSGAGMTAERYLPRVDDLRQRIAAALASRETALAGLLQSRMQAESQRIEQYLFMTRVAIAQASDQLALSEDPSPVPTGRQP